jgi:hypothetical protein
MVFAQLSNQVLFHNMSVPLGGGNRRVSEKLLHHPNVHAIAEEKCGDGVTKHMGRYMPLDSGISAKRSNDVCHTLSRKTLALERETGVRTERRKDRWLTDQAVPVTFSGGKIPDVEAL